MEGCADPRTAWLAGLRVLAPEGAVDLRGSGAEAS
jgi:hypothetical protein